MGEYAKREDGQEVKIGTCEEMYYYWKIEQDHIGTDAEGVEGPSGCDTTLRTNPATFAIYDDDHEFYYEGMIYGDYTGFEPLDDFGMPNAGATQIMINGEML